MDNCEGRRKEGRREGGLMPPAKKERRSVGKEGEERDKGD